MGTCFTTTTTTTATTATTATTTTTSFSFPEPMRPALGFCLGQALLQKVEKLVKTNLEILLSEAWPPPG